MEGMEWSENLKILVHDFFHGESQPRFPAFGIVLKKMVENNVRPLSCNAVTIQIFYEIMKLLFSEKIRLDHWTYLS